MQPWECCLIEGELYQMVLDLAVRDEDAGYVTAYYSLQRVVEKFHFPDESMTIITPLTKDEK